MLDTEVCDRISAHTKSQEVRPAARDYGLVLLKSTGKHLTDICLLLLNSLDVGGNLGTRQLLQNILSGFKKSKAGGGFKGYSFNRPRRCEISETVQHRMNEFVSF